MLETVLTSLQKMPFYSIALSAVVVFFIAISILTMFSQAKKEKTVEQLRWKKVSADMALFDASKRLIIPLEADEILVGRHGSADIRFADMSVSRYHAILYVSNGVWSIVDLDSKSGTFVNGRRIRSQVRLKDQDEIQFGNKTLLWEVYCNCAHYTHCYAGSNSAPWKIRESAADHSACGCSHWLGYRLLHCAEALLQTDDVHP